jgi:hypothetical protein
VIGKTDMKKRTGSHVRRQNMTVYQFRVAWLGSLLICLDRLLGLVESGTIKCLVAR